MKPLAHELINALAELDAKIPGLGLYSCFEYQTPAGKTHPYWKIEWEMALRPRLEALGCRLIEHPVFGKPKYCTTSPSSMPVRFLNATAKVCELRLVRTSMIKVRRYGSGYHLDRTVDFAERWAQLKMEKHVRALWWPDRHQMSADIRMILFLGFDKANRPFHKEMAALEKTSHWTERGISHKSKSWPDTYRRDFNVLVASWASNG
jgi:hypothetical protein